MHTHTISYRNFQKSYLSDSKTFISEPLKGLDCVRASDFHWPLLFSFLSFFKRGFFFFYGAALLSQDTSKDTVTEGFSGTVWHPSTTSLEMRKPV